jgi:hypothetical protein
VPIVSASRANPVLFPGSVRTLGDTLGTKPGTGTGNGAGGTWGVALVVAPDLRSAGQRCHEAFPGAHLQLVTNAATPHVVVRVPLYRPGEWPAVRATLGQLAATCEWQVLTVGPRTEWDRVEERRTRAQGLLPLARRLPLLRRVLDVDELVVFDMLGTVASDVRVAVVENVLGPVLSQPGADRLLATLECLHWNDGSAKAAARMLGVHVKTVHARLRRIEQLTGLRLDQPPDRLQVEVALYLFRAGETAATSPPPRPG